MEESFEQINGFKIFVYMAVCGLAVYLGNRFYPEVRWFFPPAIVLIIFFFFARNMAMGVLWRSRYYSYQVNVDGCHGSIYGKPEYIRDDSVRKGFAWAVFNLGHSTFPISLRGKKATLVVPADQLQPAGKGFNGLTLVQRFPLGSLPYLVHKFLRHNKNDFNLEKVYFGKYSKDYLDNSGDENDLNSQIVAKDTLIGVLQKTIEHDFENFEEIKVFADRMSSSPKLLKKLAGKLKDSTVSDD